MDIERFIKLLLGFKNIYFETYGTSLKERQMDNGIEYCINSEKELLIYTLWLISCFEDIFLVVTTKIKVVLTKPVRVF